MSGNLRRHAAGFPARSMTSLAVREVLWHIECPFVTAHCLMMFSEGATARRRDAVLSPLTNTCVSITFRGHHRGLTLTLARPGPTPPPAGWSDRSCRCTASPGDKSRGAESGPARSARLRVRLVVATGWSSGVPGVRRAAEVTASTASVWRRARSRSAIVRTAPSSDEHTSVAASASRERP